MKQAQFLVMLSPAWVIVGEAENSPRYHTNMIYDRYYNSNASFIRFVDQNIGSIMDTRMTHYLQAASGNYLTKGLTP